MKKVLSFIITSFIFHQAWTQNAGSISWIQVQTDSGVVHAAIAAPKGTGPFPAIIILHGTHGFAEEYIRLAQRMAEKDIVGIAACWFAGRKGEGTRFITPVEFNDAPPLIDVPGSDRFRLARVAIDSLMQKVNLLPFVRKDHLAIFGHSRGAGASLDYVLAHPGNVKTIILNSCGYSPEIIKRAAEFEAAVLILHGTNDNPADGGSAFTNIAMVSKFEAALRRENKQVEVKYYEGSGHNSIFSDARQFDDTVQRISIFLQNIFFK
jgi:dienelactone hydrolase